MTGVADASFVDVFDAVAERIADRECIVQGDRRTTWGDVAARTRALAGSLQARGVTLLGDPATSANWESPHAHVGVYLRNVPEHLELLIACYRSRSAPFNINFRYSGDELRYLFTDAAPAAIAYQSEFAPTLAGALDRYDGPRPLLIHVPDGTGNDPLDDSLDFEQLVIAGDPGALPASSPEDLHVLYTGGTTGYPKGVLWPQRDILGGPCGLVGTTVEAIAEAAVRRTSLRALPAPPLMHGTALWYALTAWANGGTVVLNQEVSRFDPVEVLETCTREQVTSLAVVGDAFMRPVLDAIAAGMRPPPSLRLLFSSGAILSETTRTEIRAIYPQLTIINALGSSETGPQAVQSEQSESTFEPGPSTVVLSDDRTRLLGPDEPGDGWLASRGPLPKGYLNDAARTAATYVEIGGSRFVISGDRARAHPDGRVGLLGRDATTINSGGEKIYTEEVESVLRTIEPIADVLVIGRPSEKWGQEVVALVTLGPGSALDPHAINRTAEVALARYKLPKRFVQVDAIERFANGKVDYEWARAVADAGSQSS